MDAWELTARERIRDTLAQYTWSGDAFRLEDLAAAFFEDGVLEIKTRGRFEGRAAIVDLLGGGSSSGDDEARRAERRSGSTGAVTIVRHNVTNIRFVELTPAAARVESYFTVFTDIGLDHHGRYRDQFEPDGDRWLIRHRFVSTDWRNPDSTMAAPSTTG
ncbi:MAG: nuclear transport factor 2 family protein [Actinomycetota bacterium]|nr:nuclear transport factor 2 family protein [Actinomycetota bacterium]